MAGRSTPVRTMRLGGVGVSLIAAVGLLAGCGGGSKTASTATTATSSPAAATTSTTAAGVGGPTTTAVAATSGSGTDSGSTFCRASAALKAKESSQIQNLSSPAQVQKIEQQAIAALPAFVALAPAAIKPSVVLLAAEDRILYKDLQTAGFNYQKLGSSATALVEEPKYVQAETAITTYLTKVCGITPSAGVPTT